MKDNMREIVYEIRWKRVFICVFIGIFLVMYGIGIGHYQWPPFQLISNTKTTLTKFWVNTGDEHLHTEILMEYAFTDPVIEESLFYSPIESIEGIRDANQRILMNRDDYESAFDEINLLNVKQVSRKDDHEPVIMVNFQFQSREYNAFAYGIKPASCEENQISSLIIPGSGLNQSFEIIKGNSENYHYGIYDLLKNLPDSFTYVYIKPNEDYLAWHDENNNKLDGTYIWNWQLNRNGSYSVSYIVKSMAISKWMKECFDKTLIAGLSQGGAATLLNAIQSEPTYAIVASGHSFLFRLIDGSDHNQIIGVPGYNRLMQSDYFQSTIDKTQTEWLFSWGREEMGTYGIEANENITANVIEQLSNVEIVIHDEGHVFPLVEISEYLDINFAENNAF